MEKFPANSEKNLLDLARDPQTFIVCVRDVTMFTQPQYDLLVKLAKWEEYYGIGIFW